MDKIWILTEEYNDYDQHGEYFVAWFPYLPSFEELAKYGLSSDEAAWCIHGGGGRRHYEDKWFNLKQVDAG